MMCGGSNGLVDGWVGGVDWYTVRAFVMLVFGAAACQSQLSGSREVDRQAIKKIRSLLSSILGTACGMMAACSACLLKL